MSFPITFIFNLLIRAMSGHKIFLDASIHDSKDLNPKNVVGRHKENGLNLHTDESDDISSPWGSSSATRNTIINAEKNKYSNDKEELMRGDDR